METGQCLYASKPCFNPQSFKDNGELHRLCTFHRTKANDAQRRWHSRQRTRSDPAAVAGDKSTTKKRRCATRTEGTTDDSSESDVTQVPVRRRRRKFAALTRPMALTPSLPLPLDFTELLVPSTLPPVEALAPFDGEGNALSDAELAQLSEFILELEEEPFSQDEDGFERAGWLVNVHSAECALPVRGYD